MSQFCRHNRFVADCPICSKGTVLDPNRKPERRPRPATVRRPGAKRPVQAASGVRVSRGQFAAAGPYEDGREVRLEKVPGGLRLAGWHAGQLVKRRAGARAGRPARAAGLGRGAGPAAELPAGAGRGGWRGEPGVGAHGASPGRTGELRDELRVERLDDDGCGSPAGSCGRTGAGSSRRRPCCCRRERFLGALASAAERGVLASGDPVE